MRDVPKTLTVYWLWSIVDDIPILSCPCETLEDARKALRIRAENYKGEKLRIVKETSEVVE